MKLKLAFLLGCLPALGFTQPLRIDEAFTLPAETKTVLHLALANPTSQSLVIAAFSTPLSPLVLVRNHTRVNDVNVVESGGTIEIMPHSRIKLLPEATEVALLNLTAPLQPGTEFPLTAHFTSGQTQTFRVEVKGD